MDMKVSTPQKDHEDLNFGVLVVYKNVEDLQHFCSGFKLPILSVHEGSSIEADHIAHFLADDVSKERREFIVIIGIGIPPPSDEILELSHSKGGRIFCKSEDVAIEEFIIDVTNRIIDYSPDRKKNKQSWIHWIDLGNGRISVWHRPKRIDFQRMAESGVTHLVTLLKDSELAKNNIELYSNSCSAHGITWIRIPLKGAKVQYLSSDGAVEILVTGILQLHKLLHAKHKQPSLLIHCAAGVHRTGVVSYSLLRIGGFSIEEAKRLLFVCRPETAIGVDSKKHKRTKVAEDFVIPQILHELS